MAIKKMLGLLGIDYADIPVGGGVATTWTPLGATYRDSAKLTEADASETEHYSNESDDPIEVTLLGGKKTFEFELINVDEDNLILWLGGTVSGTGSSKVWNAPDNKPVFEKQFRARSRDGQYVVFPRVKFHATVDWMLSPNGIFKVKVKGTILNPDDATAPIVKGTTGA